MTAITRNQILALLQNHPGWRLEDSWLARDLQFSDFRSAWQFMNFVAECAEQQDHHPNWYNVYGTVQIRLSSHDAGGVTKRDFALATKIDEYLSQSEFLDLPATPILRA
jgi:4a-hydroxytetrahydrobiopterin dehydratase